MVRLIIIGLLLPTLSLAQASNIGNAESADNPVTLSTKPVLFSSAEGDFRITFPSGCGKTVTRVPADEAPDVDGQPGIRVTFTFCDRNQEKGEGCSVTSYFNVMGADGGYPGADQVIERMTLLLKSMNLAIREQSPLSKKLPDGTTIEGLDLLAAEPSGVGQAWLRGLLYEGDIYILSAWKNTGKLWDDSDYITFFNSFQPGAEYGTP